MADPLHLLHVKNQEIAQLKLRIQQEQEIVAHVQMSQVMQSKFKYPGFRDSRTCLNIPGSSYQIFIYYNKQRYFSR